VARVEGLDILREPCGVGECQPCVLHSWFRCSMSYSRSQKVVEYGESQSQTISRRTHSMYDRDANGIICIPPGRCKYHPVKPHITASPFPNRNGHKREELKGKRSHQQMIRYLLKRFGLLCSECDESLGSEVESCLAGDRLAKHLPKASKAELVYFK
jgi:hypothetical protein